MKGSVPEFDFVYYVLCDHHSSEYGEKSKVTKREYEAWEMAIDILLELIHHELFDFESH